LLLGHFGNIDIFSFGFGWLCLSSYTAMRAAGLYSLLSKVLVIHFLAGVATTILITKIAVTQQQQRLCNKE